MNSFIYVYEEMPESLATNGHTLIDFVDLPEISRSLNDKFSFYGNYQRRGQNQKYIKEGHFIKALTENGSWQYFEIFKVKKTLNSISFNARFIGAMANKNFIDYCFTAAGNGSQIMTNLQNSLAFKQKFVYTSNVPTVHQFTAKQVKPIDALIGSNNGNQNLVGVTGAELDVDNYNLNLVKQIGSDNGYRIDIGINLEAIEAEIDQDSIANSLFLVGGVPENDYDEDKEPITYKYLEIAGVNDQNRRIVKRENSNCKTVEELKEWGQTLFDKDRIHEAPAIHKVNMVALEHTLEYGEMYEQLAKLRFGDVAHVYVPELDINIKERMVEYVWFPTIGKFKSIVLGNNLSKYTSRVQTETEKLADKINNRTESLVQTLLNATAWITGNSGGHVVFRPEKAPSEILIMDQRDIAKAKKIWRWNLNGLGYTANGINGNFEVAITSKGEIVANFIKVGIIQADVFENSFNATGDVMKMVNGLLQVWNDSKKIMELTKKGIEFWDMAGNHVGSIGTIGNPFPSLINGMTGSKDNAEGSIFITSSKTGRYIGISPQADQGILVMNGGEKGAQTRIIGNINSIQSKTETRLEGNVVCFKDVDVLGKLSINGQQVFPGQGGSGGVGEWDGSYPAGFTSQSDQFLWQWWVYFISLGFSPAAAAGILGNIRGEAGPSFNPDTDQVGGPAYGGVQFDGSSYPLVGPPTWNGREYVQTLMRAAGITLDYRTTKAQAQLIDWALYNGQWLGRVQPTSVAAFKTISDPAQAAYAFEENFERPANAHAERQGWAVEIYNRLKDIPISYVTTGGGTRAKFIEIVLAQAGKQYVWGAKGPDVFDCSGLFYYAATQVGLANFGGWTGAQVNDWNHMQEISEGELQRGDLIFYGAYPCDHVAMYLGPGQRFHASAPDAFGPGNGINYDTYQPGTYYRRIKTLNDGSTGVGADGLNHLKGLLGRRIGNGQCYAASAQYSGFLGGCGLGAGTQYGLSHVIGNTSAASDIGIAYNWAAVNWKVILNPNYSQLVPGAIINWARGGRVGSWFADGTYGHTGIIRGLANNRIQTYEQNTEFGQVIAELDREFYGASHISSIVIPPK